MDRESRRKPHDSGIWTLCSIEPIENKVPFSLTIIHKTVFLNSNALWHHGKLTFKKNYESKVLYKLQNSDLIFLKFKNSKFSFKKKKGWGKAHSEYLLSMYKVQGSLFSSTKEEKIRILSLRGQKTKMFFKSLSSCFSEHTQQSTDEFWQEQSAKSWQEPRMLTRCKKKLNSNTTTDLRFYSELFTKCNQPKG